MRALAGAAGRAHQVNHRKLASARAEWVWRPRADRDIAERVAFEVRRMAADLQLSVAVQLMVWETSGDREAWRLVNEVRSGLLGLRGAVAKAIDAEPLAVGSIRRQEGDTDAEDNGGTREG